MFAELANFSLILALLLACVGATVPLYGVARGQMALARFGFISSILQFSLVLFSFAVLTRHFVQSDFSVRVVYLNSYSLKPLLYKISGVWGNHEGSLLLWILILTLFGFLIAVFGKNLPYALHTRVMAVQSAISASFLAFAVFTSNPFERLNPPPFEGQGLNPLLQDPGLAFHPPFLYLGYVGLSVTFSFAIAALMGGQVNAAWGRWVRPWTLAAWIFLTIGIGLGSWWAYYELGWGGFWFWDPVENASFMPWLIAVALLHSSIVVEKRETLKAWTILLAILAFGFSLLGAFIVRSGVITSVHSFANDPQRGIFLLLILLIFLGGALLLFALRAPALKSHAVFAPISRETGLIANNILMSLSCLVVFIGTMWPVIAELFWNQRLSVGPPFFNVAFTPFFMAVAALLPLASVLPWKRARLARHLKPILPFALLALMLVGMLWAVQTGRSLIGPIGMALGSWVIVGAAQDLWRRARNRTGHIFAMSGADWGKTLAHIGFGLAFCGIAGLSAWQYDSVQAVELGQKMQVGRYQFQLADVQNVLGPNYSAVQGVVKVSTQLDEIGTLYPEQRFYFAAQSGTTEAAIYNGFWRDIYVVIGAQQEDGTWALRVFIKPFVNWIWGGVLVMALGGAISLFDRRYRIAAAGRGQA